MRFKIKLIIVGVSWGENGWMNVTEDRLRWLRILYRIKLRRLFPLLAEISIVDQGMQIIKYYSHLILQLFLGQIFTILG